MAKVCYVPHRFQAEKRRIIETADEILQNFADRGYKMSLRSLFYQFVGRGLLDNWESVYKSLGRTLSDARNAGLIDWDHIVDLNRELIKPPAWDDPSQLVRAAAHQFQRDPWVNQPVIPEVWIEKQALLGVAEDVCAELRIPLFACKGNASTTVIRKSAMRFVRRQQESNQGTIILYMGDHDPNGVDMTRDVEDRIDLYVRGHVDFGPVRVRRIALNRDQVEEHGLPPQPVKKKDTRTEKYVAQHGTGCWELDALPPDMLVGLIRQHVNGILDEEGDRGLYEQVLEQEERDRELLDEVADNFDEIVERFNK